MAETMGIIALMCLMFGGATMLANKRQRWLANRTTTTPTTRIADAKGEGIVEIVGTFRRGEEEPERIAPLAGKPALWWHVMVQTSYTSNDSTSYTTHYEESSRAPLWIDDGSGEVARVETDCARFEVVTTRVHQPPPDARVFCELHDLPWKESYEYVVQVICEGEPAYALGLSRREAGRPRPDGYRDVATNRLVLFGSGPDRPWAHDEELLVANRKEKELVTSLSSESSTGRFFFAVGLVCGAISLLVRFALR